MKLKQLALASALALGMCSAFAGDQLIDLSSGQGQFMSSSVPNVLSGGIDVITFSNLAAGTYNFVLSLSSQYINWTGVDLNGLVLNAVTPSGHVTNFSLESTGHTPFSLILAGTPASSRAMYSGEISVTAVPEPGTYALLLAGLGVMGFVARRRNKK